MDSKLLKVTVTTEVSSPEKVAHLPGRLWRPEQTIGLCIDGHGSAGAPRLFAWRQM